MPYSMGTKIAVFWTLLNMVPCISLSFSFFFFLVVEHFHFIIIIYIFNIIYFGHTRSSLLCSGFLQLQWALAPLCCGAPASHSGFFIVEHGLQVFAVLQLWHKASLLQGNWNLPRLEIKSVFLALVGRFLFTVQQGSSC